MENRHIALVTALSLAVGLVFGVIAGALWTAQRVAPVSVSVRLDPAEQDDFIIAAAEAFAGDHDIRLAQDRLARLHSRNISARVERLAAGYAQQRDLIARQLAGLALALGSRNIALVRLNVIAAPTPVAQPAAPAGLPAAAKLSSLTSTPIALLPGQAPKLALPSATPARIASADIPQRRPTATSSSNQSGAGKGSATSPTRAPASNAKPNIVKQPPPDSGRVVSAIAVSVPDYAGAPPLSIPLHAPPSKCTPPSQLPSVVDRTIVLCANQEYPPFRVNGNNLTVYGDSGGTSHIQAPARAFGITVSGSNITITGVHIDADTDPADMNTWLCLYEECHFKGTLVRGAMNYGGGILIDHATSVAVISSTVSSGTIGVASVHGSNNMIVNNNLSNLNGWGAFVFWSDKNAVVGNTMNNVTRSCMGPDGAHFTSGCESAGIAVIRAQTNLFANNHCEHSSNCVYASGDGGYSSNDNKFFNNYCAASPHNCYEITFSAGNQFDYNVATSDPNTGDSCTYPFWISGSNVNLGQHNTWNCKYSAKQAFSDSQRATEVTTSANGF